MSNPRLNANLSLERDKIKKSNKMAKLVLLSADENNFYSILREKLNWGTNNLKN